MSRKLLAGILAILALAATACSSNPASSLLPVDVVRAAPERMEEAKTVAFDFQVDVAFDAAGSGDAFDGMFEDGVTLNADGAIDFENSRMELNMSFLFVAMQVLQDGEDCYIRSNFISGDKWVESDCDTANLTGEVAEGLDSFFSGDPTSIVNDFAQYADEVEDLGEEDIDGVKTRHYRFTIKGDDLDDDFPDGEELPVDLWIDEDGRMRRVAIDVYIEDPDEGTVDVAMELDFHDYGEPVEIEMPAPEDIVDEPPFGGDWADAEEDNVS